MAKEVVHLTAPVDLAPYQPKAAPQKQSMGGGGGGIPIAPEIAKLPAGKTLCLYGEDDDDALCPSLPPGNAQVIKLPGDHHFKGDYDRLAQTLLDHLPAR